MALLDYQFVHRVRYTQPPPGYQKSLHLAMIILKEMGCIRLASMGMQQSTLVNEREYTTSYPVNVPTLPED